MTAATKWALPYNAHGRSNYKCQAVRPATKSAGPRRTKLFAKMASVGQSRGKHETLLLKSTITDQLNRLLTQLEDLDELKEGAGLIVALCGLLPC